MNEAEIIRQHLNDDVYTLSLQKNWFECFDKKWLLQQIQSRQKAKSKLPSWYGNFDLIFPPPLSVEQSSSELTAQYKATLVSGKLLLDLTGGMGIDSSFFAHAFEEVIFIERQAELAEIAQKNFQILRLNNIRVTHGDSINILDNFPAADCIFVDPSRRKGDKKVFLLEECEPNILLEMPALLKKSHHILLKLSPMLDIRSIIEKIPETEAVHVVAVNHEIKELLVLISTKCSGNTDIVCVNIDKNNGQQIHRFDYSRRDQSIPFAEMPMQYLYEPHVTLLKSGLMNEEAKQWDLQKLHPHSQLYTSDVLHSEFFGRIFRIENVFGLSKSELKRGLSDISKANITMRNFPLTESELRKKLKVNDGGDITLFATTLHNQKHVLIRATRVTDEKTETIGIIRRDTIAQDFRQ